MEKRRRSSNEAVARSQDPDLKMNTVFEERARIPADEWLGPESHMPNLGYELCRRDKRMRGTSGSWIVGAVFVAGLTIGSLAALLIARSRRSA